MRCTIARARRRRTASTLAGAAMLLGAAAIVTGAASPGTLVRSFGIAGVVTTDFRGSEDIAHAVAPAPGGRVVAAGGTNGPGGSHMGIARYMRDGRLDVTFGTGGLAEVDTGDPFDMDQAFALDVHASGGIVLGGHRRRGPTGCDFAIAVLTRRGTPDPSFGSNGIVTSDFGADARIDRVKFLSRGRILAAGRRLNPGTGDGELVLARYQRDGSLDTSFAGGGWVVSTLPVDRAAIDSRGGVMAVGDGVDYDDTFLVARYTPDGSLDPAFGTAGATTIQMSRFGAFDALALTPDGGIALGGNVVRAEEVADVAVVRLTRSGELDRSFGVDGIASAPLAAMITSVAAQPDGKILAAGFTYGQPYAPFVRSFAVVRFDRLGRLDASFGTGGIAVTSIRARAEPRSLVLLPGGDVLVAGFTEDTSGSLDFALARYHGH